MLRIFRLLFYLLVFSFASCGVSDREKAKQEQEAEDALDELFQQEIVEEGNEELDSLNYNEE